jgi:predicted alpha/beta hydrolase family esterase
MPKQVLFIQGGGAGTHDVWDNKLVASLARELGHGYDIRYPRMPNEAEPSYATWKKALEREIAKLDDGAFLVGHSIGATILINALAEAAPDRKFSGLFLISAPFIGPGGWPSEEIKPQQDLGNRLPRALPGSLYQGPADDTAPPAHVDLYKRAIRDDSVLCGAFGLTDGGRRNRGLAHHRPLSREGETNAWPFSVSLYFWSRLLGFSGIVSSMVWSPSSTRIT